MQAQGHGPHDLISGGLEVFASAIADAVRIGFAHEVARTPSPSGGMLAQSVCSDYRRGHVRALRAAYMAGRLHAKYFTEARVGRNNARKN